MTINVKRYVIATKGFPLLFENDECEDIGDLETAAFYNTKEIAENELTRFDEPNKRQIVEVSITYEI